VPPAPALTYGKATLSYGELQDSVSRFASGLISLGLARGERVASIWKNASRNGHRQLWRTGGRRCIRAAQPFAQARAGRLHHARLQCPRAGHLARRLALLQETLPACHDLRHVVVSMLPTRCRPWAP
jgi:acyl-CoA synthetase (AMP-forming)/AMP-acid ligase II